MKSTLDRKGFSVVRKLLTHAQSSHLTNSTRGAPPQRQTRQAGSVGSGLPAGPSWGGSARVKIAVGRFLPLAVPVSLAGGRYIAAGQGPGRQLHYRLGPDTCAARVKLTTFVNLTAKNRGLVGPEFTKQIRRQNRPDLDDFDPTDPRFLAKTLQV